jgi:putative ABC transport system permease protein
MISVPAGIVANQESSQNMASFLKGTMNNLEQEINTTADQIVVRNSTTLAPTGFPVGGYSGGQYSGTFTGGFFNGRAEGSYINEKIVNASVISEIPGVVAVWPTLEHSEVTMENQSTQFGTRRFPHPIYTIEGVPLNSSLIDNYSILPANVTEGRNLHENDTGAVLLSQNNSEYFGVGVGDMVSILGQNFKVVGIYQPSTSTQNTTLYMNITDAQTLTNMTGEVSQFTIYAQNSSDIDAIVTAIGDIPVSSSVSSTLSFTDVNTLENNLSNATSLYNDALAAAQSTTSEEQNTAVQDIAIAVVATSLIVLFVMLYTVRERTKEIGTLKAIGFGNWNVMSQFMLEGILLSLGAGVVGIAIGSIGASSLAGVLGLIPAASRNSLFGSSGSTTFRYSPGAGLGAPGFTVARAGTAVITPQLMLMALGAAILLGALGSLYPAWRASRTRPAEAMKYE